MTTPLLKPSLYALDASGEPVLLGGRCACGHTFFPMQIYGCERCGKHGEALQPHALIGRGQLVATAVVHMHADPRRIAPFIVGTIALDDGPIVRTLIDDSGAATASPTQRVRAALVPVNTEQGEALDLRFVLDTVEHAS